jgi:CHAT domain
MAPSRDRRGARWLNASRDLFRAVVPGLLRLAALGVLLAALGGAVWAVSRRDWFVAGGLAIGLGLVALARFSYRSRASRAYRRDEIQAYRTTEIRSYESYDPDILTRSYGPAEEAPAAAAPAPAPPPGAAPPDDDVRGVGPRYANLRLEELDGTDAGLVRAGTDYWLVVSIDALQPSSIIERPVPFPREILPRTDLTLDVVVSSATFLVGDRHDGALTRATRNQLRLPADDGPARAPDGRTELGFAVRSPGASGAARIRVTYYFRDAVVQSQVVDVDVDGSGRPIAGTDYTASADLRGLEAIRDRRRVAIVVNQDPSGNHGISIRSHLTPDVRVTHFDIEPEQLREPLDNLRQELNDTDTAPRTVKRTRKQLVNDLRRLAPHGAVLFEKMFVQAREVLTDIDLAEPGFALHIAPSSVSRFTLPWAFLYKFPLPDTARASVSTVPICDVVNQWDAHDLLANAPSGRCPHEGEESHRKPILCPYGFWGIRYEIELMAPTTSVIQHVTADADHAAVALLATNLGNPTAVESHVSALGDALRRGGCGGMNTARALTEAETQLDADLPIVYMLCHGIYTKQGGPDTHLCIGRNESLTPSLLTSWLVASKRWQAVRPLVFINACHSVALQPKTTLGYVEAFIGAGGAAGVIGTEATVHEDLAREAANIFFRYLLEHQTVGSALHSLRAELLASGNLFGLLYGSYGWADLHIARLQDGVCGACHTDGHAA